MIEKFNPKARAYFDGGDEDVQDDQQHVYSPVMIRAFVLDEQLITDKDVAAAFSEYLYARWNQFDDESGTFTNADVLMGCLQEWIDSFDHTRINTHEIGQDIPAKEEEK